MMDVSVIVPALNEEKNIRKCLRSIRKQKTGMDFELILSDGGSDDATVGIGGGIADRVVKSRKGIANGRNAGARAAKGRVLVFIDADSSIPPNYLDVVAPVLADPGISGVSNCFCFDRAGKRLKLIQDACNGYLLMKGLAGKAEMLGFNCAVRRNDFFRVGGFPNQPLEDNGFKHRMLRLGRTVCLPEPKAITSARRIDDAGPVNTLIYYTNLKIMSELPKLPIKKLLNQKDYLPIR